MNAPSVRRCVAVCAVVLRVGPLAAQGVPAPPSLTVHTIWGTRDFASDLVSLAWMKDGKAYTTLDDASGNSDLNRVDALTGKKDLLLRAADLVPPGARQPVTIERSEERRVGKECRSRMSQDVDVEKKKDRT